ncbi:MAG: hypothetical protein JJE40_14700 [Vicinamibacteria bacterium]|nr:hypothetical protein [Vicinamibacteria bacterium]
MRHQVTVRVIAEQWASGALKEFVALEGVLRPSQVVGMPIALRFVPGKWPSGFPPEGMGPEQGLRALALEQHTWTATLVVDRKPVSQAVIRDTGDLAPPSEAGGAGAIGGAFGTFEKRLDDALGPTPPPAAAQGPDGSKALTSAWVEYEIQHPGERPQTIRRALFDLIGPAARAAGPTVAPRVDEAARLTRSLALLREIEILPVVCRFGPDYVTHLAAQSLLANRAILTEAMRGDALDDFAHVQDLAKRLAPIPSPLYALALARFEWSNSGGRTYIDTPNILTRHTFFAPVAKSFKLVVATDIVANEIGVDLMVDSPFAVRLEQGVLDTNAEAILASDRPDASNAGSAFADSRSWTTLRGPGDPQLGTLELADDVRRRMADDLAAGYLVVAPRAPVTVGAGAFAGYWRVNPATGHTLGIGSTGYGQEMVEYLITAVLAIELTMFFYYFFCRLASGPGSAAACKQAAIEQGVLAALISLLVFLAPAMGIGLKGAGGVGKGPNADPFAKTQADPFGKTNPGLGADPAANPWGKTNPGGKGPGAPGGKPGGQPNIWNDPEWQQAVQKLNDAEKKLAELTDNSPLYHMYGDKALEIAPESALGKAAAEELEAFRELARLGLERNGLNPSLVSPPGSPLGGSVTPGPAGAPTPGGGTGAPPTGPGGTQIMKGPGQTQIMKGPGQTQKIPQPNCPGPACPPTAQQKTQTGLGGVANALGQKVGGGS